MASNGKITVNSSSCDFTIKIDNFTPELGETGKFMNYRFTFGADNNRTNWRISIYPKGVDSKSKDFMSVFFYLDNNRPNFCAFQMSILDESGSEKYTQIDDRVCPDKTPSGRGWYEYISRDDLFKKENQLIKDNALTLTGKFEFVNESKFVQKASKSKEFDKITDLFQKRSFTDFKIHIHDKSIKAHKILLAANSPMFAEVVENQNYLRLHYFEFEVVEEMVNFIYDGKVSDMGRFAKPLLEVADKFKINRLKVYFEKYLYENLWIENAIETLKLSAKCHAEELKDECIDFIQKHISAIVQQNWETFVVDYPALFNEIFKKCVRVIDRKLKELFNEKERAERENEALLNNKCNLTALYTNMPFSDVELEVEGKILKAHKAILWGRSTVFQAMFSHDMIESTNNRVVINDFDFQTMQELLRYIYCGEVLNLKEVALDLLQAADKYNLLELKEKCAKSLESNMTVENITAILNIADLHNCSELKAKAIAFIGRNILAVIETTKWDELIQLKPKLLNQLFLDWVEKFF